jgi:5-(carboxyamino)imidazole ribonucleotide mutase
MTKLIVKPLVGIIMGSDSDLPVMKDAALILDSFGVSNEIKIVSAHRTPERMINYAKDAKKSGIQVIIAGAGGAAHLPGMVAAITPIPVIGVPIRTTSMNGLDSLMSIVQMPTGVPVATVAIDGARNAGILACQILALKYERVAVKIEKYKKELERRIIFNAEKLERKGIKTHTIDTHEP